MAKFVVSELNMYAFNQARVVAIYVEGSDYVNCDIPGILVDAAAPQTIRNQIESNLLSVANQYLNYYGYPSIGPSDIEYLC